MDSYAWSGGGVLAGLSNVAVHIVIRPLPSGLYHVRTLNQQAQVRKEADKIYVIKIYV